MGVKEKNNAKKDPSSTALLEKKNDALVNRMMIMFVLATIAIVALLLLKKSGSSTVNVFVFRVLPWLQIVSGLIFAGAIAYFVVVRKKGIDESIRNFTSGSFLGVSFVMFSVFMLYKLFGSTKVVILIIAALVLAFVYSFYQRDFLWFSIFTLAQSIMLYAVKSVSSASALKNVLIIICKVLSFAIPVIVAVLFIVVLLNKGNLNAGKHKVCIMKPSYMYSPFFVGAGIGLVGTILGILVNGIAIYSILALLAVYLVFAIIYTVKMI